MERASVTTKSPCITPGPAELLMFWALEYPDNPKKMDTTSFVYVYAPSDIIEV